MAGLEPILVRELENLGASSINTLRRGVAFIGDKKLLYRANLELHTALRVLVPIHQFRASNERTFYRNIQKIDWSDYLDLEDTFAINAIAFSDYFKHSHYVALKTKDAIVDQFRKKTGKRPSIDIHQPRLRIQVHINDDQCSISLDSSGDSLHKRGYRTESVEAPINEVLAAGLIGLTEWEMNCDFIDPMCGSGTFLIEAALWAFNIPPQLHRKDFGFTKWRDFDPELWEEVLENAKASVKPFNHSIRGYDKSFKAIKATQQNILTAHLEGKIEIERQKFEKLNPSIPDGLIVMNPPYDERLTESNVNELYSQIGNQLKHAFTGYTAWIISSNKEALKHIGLKPSRKITIFNGQLECKFQQFKMYKGSKKAKHLSTAKLD